ncbi:MAG: hypothetical protein JJE35_01810 [Thermoleophilia bacterium]|nr:hypothetical protein [Thermoleophilia bacterium]
MSAVICRFRRIASLLGVVAAILALTAATAVAAPTFSVKLTSQDHNDVQAVFVEATTGQFKLEFGVGGPGVSETGDIAATATAADVQTALNSLANISAGGGSVSVVKPAFDTNGTLPFLVTFDGGPLALKLQPLLRVKNGSTSLGASPLGGGPATAYVATRVPGGVSHSDERIDYKVDIKNAANPVPTTGDQLVCNGASPPLGTKEWFRQATTGYSFEFQWLRSGVAATGWIAGEPGKTYTLTAADAGSSIQCLVKGTNGTGSGSFVVASQPTLVTSPVPVVEPPKPNSATVRRPAIAGPLKTGTEVTVGAEWKVGEELRCTAPTAGWSTSNEQSAITWTFQWLRDGAPAPGAVTSPTATTSRYALTAEDVTAPAAPAVFQCLATATNAAGGVAIVESAEKNTKAPPVGTPAFEENTTNGAPFQAPVQVPVVETTNASFGPISVTFELPSGFESFVYVPGTGGTEWSCAAYAAGAEPAKAVCTNSKVLAPGASLPPLVVAAALGADAPDSSAVNATVSDGGAIGSASATSEFTIEPAREFGFLPGRFSARALGAGGDDYTKAGGHPAAATTSFSLTRDRKLVDQSDLLVRPRPVELLRNVSGDVPPGFIGNPQAVAELCPTAADALAEPSNCPPGSAVGELAFQAVGLGTPAAGLSYKRMVLYAIAPEAGAPAQFAAVEALNQAVYVLTPRLRPGDGYAISIDSIGTVENPEFLDLRVTLCGYGANTVLSAQTTLFGSCKKSGDPGAFAKPFLTSQTECASPGPTTNLHMDSWTHPGDVKTVQAVSPKMTECELVPFDPTLDLQPTSKEAESASGLDVDLSVPTDGFEDPDGVSQAHLKRTTVTLPAGMSVNPSAADGMEACTQAQLGMVNGVPNNDPVKCPDASKVGTAVVKTPILEEPLEGGIYLAKQGDNPFGTLVALYVVVESKERGILIKLPGRVDIRPNGQLVSTFDDNPQAPFSSLKLNFFSGNRAALMTPQRCGSYDIVSELTPWSAADPDNPTVAETVTQTSNFQVSSGPGGGACPTGALQPAMKAGLTSPVAGSSSPFVVALSRPDGTQRINGLAMTLPPGLAASLKGVPYCSDATLAGIPTAEGTGAAEIANPSCPAASRVGSVSVGAGAGNPYYVNTGKAYLAGPYKGAPVSLAVVVPAVAGPFDLGNVVVRNPIFVNPKTAQVSIKSDPLPTSLHNLPIDVRDIRVTVDKQGFMRAPTNCEVMSVDAVISGEEGGSAPLSNRFQVGECGSLGFKPNVKLQLHGGTRRGKYQRLVATVTAREGDANIARAAVTFPHSAFLAQEHIVTVCTRVQFAANACPKGSIYGYATATTPLLDHPIQGNVYLRSNPEQELPDLVAALRGPDFQPIEIELSGRTDSKNEGIRNTFDIVPDAPVSKFILQLKGGKKSLIVNSRDLCKGTQRATVRLNAQNGMVRNFRPVVGNDCGKKKAPGKKKSRKNKH